MIMRRDNDNDVELIGTNEPSTKSYAGERESEIVMFTD